MNDLFNPLDWIEPDPKPVSSDQSQYAEAPAPGNPFVPSHPRPLVPSAISFEVDTVISRIEASLTDITTSYQDWLNVGFALANEFGEAGRSYFHRVSRFYNGYTKTDCDRQFDQCLKSTPSSRCITIKTFFHMAKQAGIEVRGRGSEGTKTRGYDGTMGREYDGAPGSDQSQYSEGAVAGQPFVPSCSRPLVPSSPAPQLPTLPDSIFPRLPEFLQKVVEGAYSKEERDILLLGALGVFSACFPKLWGIYDGKKVYANLYLFITAQASAGKGRLTFCKQLVNPIHWERRQETLRQKQIYDLEMREYNIARMKDPNAEKPVKPPELMLFIPANSSATGMFQLLAENDGRGLIFETEGDTMAQAFKSDHGNYSDGFRKGYHHEMISYYRRTDHEYKEIRYPCISTVLSGTPRQVLSLIPGVEDGLFSRFIFYHMNLRPVWKNVFARENNRIMEEHFNDLGQEFLGLYKALGQHPEMQFSLTREQEVEFNSFFEQVQEKYLTLQGMDYMGTIRRLGLIAFRMAMVLTALRIMETGDFSEHQVCSDTDFQNALSIISILVKHSSYVFTQLPEDTKSANRQNKKEQLLDKLPGKFTSQEFLNIAKDLSITARTANRYIATFCEKGLLRREQAGSYTNPNRLPGDDQAL